MSLYNVYRPMTWESVIGQEGNVETLKNMVAEDRMSSTLLFVGPRGTGKTTCARIMAKALNCETPNAPGVPCGECSSCKEIANDESLNVMEIDAASSTGVDSMRELKSSSEMVGAGGRWKIYVIDECHMLSKAAQNAALKMFEESPPKTIYVLCTTELHKLEGTIVSRSLRFDFRPVTIDALMKRLSYIASEEKIEVEEAALAMVAKIAHGGVRDSISIFERIAIENGNKVLVSGVVRSLGITPTEIIMRLGEVIQGNHRTGLEIAKEVIENGYDIHQFLLSGIDYYRDLMMIKLDMSSLVKVEKSLMGSMDEVSGTISQEHISNAIGVLESAIGKYKYTDNKQILLELSLYKIASGPKIESTGSSQVVSSPGVDPNMVQQMIQQAIKNLNIQPVSVPVNNPQPQSVRQDTIHSIPSAPASPQQIAPQVINSELDWIRANWHQFIQACKGANNAIGIMLEMAEPLRFENNTLHIGFKGDTDYFANMFNQQMVMESSNILSGGIGKRCFIEAEHLAESHADTVDSIPIVAPIQVQNNFEAHSTFQPQESHPIPSTPNGSQQAYIDNTSTPQVNETQSFMGQPTSKETVVDEPVQANFVPQANVQASSMPNDLVDENMIRMTFGT